MTTYTYVTKTFTHLGKRYYIRGKTEREATEKLIRKQIELERRDMSTGGSTLLRDWFPVALNTFKPNITAGSAKQIEYRFQKHVLSEIGDLPLDQITPLHCQRILNRQKGMSKNHIARIAQEMFFAFDTARKNGMISVNPAADLVKPAGYAHVRRALTPEEREHLLRILPTDERFVLFELMLYCGCRPAEAAGVRYSDVIAKQGVPFLHIRGTKTANSDRFVPLPDEMSKLRDKRPSSASCALTKAGTPFNTTSYKRLVKRLKRELNISMGAKLYRNALVPPLPLAEDFTPYILRHTYCTDLKKKGVDIRIAKQLMGHADIRTTANIYDHADDDSLMLAAAQMGVH